MESIKLDNFLKQIRIALEHDEINEAIATLESLRIPDRAELFSELDDEDQIKLLPNLKPADSADILEKLEDEDAAELVEALPTEAIIPIIEEMEPDEVADLLGDLDPNQAETILAGLEDPEEIRPLLLHPDDSAGGLMTPEFLILRRRMTAAEALKAIRQWNQETEASYYLFVVDQFRHLVGVVNMRQLIVAHPETLIADIMDPDVISVPVGTDQEECSRIMSRYDLLALPVLDANHVLLGIITVDDVIDILEDEATEDIQRLGGAAIRSTLSGYRDFCHHTQACGLALVTFCDREPHRNCVTPFSR
jgi:magnesium transporter